MRENDIGGRDGKSRKILHQNNILTFVSKMIMINDIDSQSGAAKVMTIEDIKKGESDILEFKREFPDKGKNILKTIVAFANGEGGTVVVGVDDRSLEIVGVDEADVFKIKDKIANSISDNITPQIVPRISYERIDDKTIIIIKISKGQNTPYCIKSEGLDGVYLRIDATTRPAERYAVQELSLLGMNKTYDEIVQRGIDEVKQSDIDFLISAFSARSKKKVSVENLVSWKLLKEDGDKLYPSVAFRLLANNDLHFARIQCGLFKGTDKVHFLDRKEFDGSVLEQIENAINFLIQHLNIGAEIKGLYRRDIYEIPEEIWRELVTNAVMHRNYLLHSYIQICVYDDRVEIVSPG
ncbi:MAG: putative DNA binding domain-containing protein, partial [Spirochaetales bacterium]|nr:putative DNA binding domain-containing protein [Spirochaetales bacterium]